MTEKSSSSALPRREDLDDVFKWNLEDIYRDVDAWEEDFSRVGEDLPRMSSFKGGLGESAEKLLECLRIYEEVGERLGKVFVYATMRSHEDTGNSEAKALADRAMMLNVQVSTATSFIVPEILTISEKTIRAFLDESEDLRKYDFFLQKIMRQKKHVLSAREEEIIAAMGEVASAPENVFSMLTNADLKFPVISDADGNEVELSEERYYKLIRSGDRRVRRDAFSGIHETYGSFRNTIGATYGASVKEDIFSARIHHYDTSLEAALDDNNIPAAVYDNVIDTVNRNLEPLHEYMALRREVLGVDKVHMYDLYVPLVKEPVRNVSWEEAKNLVVEGLSVLGPKYQELLREGFRERWIDVYENQGKRKGAYSWGSYGTQPYVLLNYNGTLRDVFTVAHEMGHSLHSWFSHRSQPYIYGDYSIFVAEVASTTNEALLMEYLLDKWDSREEQLYLLNDYLEQVRTAVYRQTLFAEFERIAHADAEGGRPLTPEALSEIWHDLYVRYYGPDTEVDRQIDIEWARIPHFYSAFYVYQYVTGFAAATSLSRQMLHDGVAARDRYIDFLRGGCSRYPIDLLRGAGVDMASPRPLEDTLAVFREKLEDLKKLMAR